MHVWAPQPKISAVDLKTNWSSLSVATRRNRLSENRKAVLWEGRGNDRTLGGCSQKKGRTSLARAAGVRLSL